MNDVDISNSEVINNPRMGEKGRLNMSNRMKIKQHKNNAGVNMSPKNVIHIKLDNVMEKLETLHTSGFTEEAIRIELQKMVEEYGSSLAKGFLIIFYHCIEFYREEFKMIYSRNLIYPFDDVIPLTKDDIEMIIA